MTQALRESGEQLAFLRQKGDEMEAEEERLTGQLLELTGRVEF